MCVCITGAQAATNRDGHRTTVQTYENETILLPCYVEGISFINRLWALRFFFRFPEMINRPFSRPYHFRLSFSLSLVSSSIRARAHRCRITAIYEIARHFAGPNHNLNPRDNKRGVSFETSLFLPTRAYKIRIKWHVEEGVFPRSC